LAYQTEPESSPGREDPGATIEMAGPDSAASGDLLRNAHHDARVQGPSNRTIRQSLVRLKLRRFRTHAADVNRALAPTATRGPQSVRHTPRKSQISGVARPV
jgi:hypothetical protein